MRKIFFSLLLVLTLAACLETGAALQQPATPTPQPTDNPTATATATEAPQVCQVTAQALNIRSGPGLSYAVIGWIYAGDIVTVKTQRGAWYQTGRGWIHSHYCEE